MNSKHSYIVALTSVVRRCVPVASRPLEKFKENNNQVWFLFLSQLLQKLISWDSNTNSTCNQPNHGTINADHDYKQYHDQPHRAANRVEI